VVEEGARSTREGRLCFCIQQQRGSAAVSEMLDVFVVSVTSMALTVRSALDDVLSASCAFG